MRTSTSPVTDAPAMCLLQAARDEAEILLREVPIGEGLKVQHRELIAFAVRMSVTTLDSASARVHAQCALDSGATKAQLHELLFLISGLGVHTLFEGTRLVNRLVAPSAGARTHDLLPLDEQRQQLWDKWVGKATYWESFEREVPGFLIELLHATPEGFDAFFRYCAVPWTSKTISPRLKELVSMAVDATPTHCFLPGMRLHLRNAVALGAGRDAVLRTLEIAAGAPIHSGVI